MHCLNYEALQSVPYSLSHTEPHLCATWCSTPSNQLLSPIVPHCAPPLLHCPLMCPTLAPHGVVPIAPHFSSPLSHTVPHPCPTLAGTHSAPLPSTTAPTRPGSVARSHALRLASVFTLSCRERDHNLRDRETIF